MDTNLKINKFWQSKIICGDIEKCTCKQAIPVCLNYWKQWLLPTEAADFVYRCPNGKADPGTSFKNTIGAKYDGRPSLQLINLILFL